MRNRKTFLLSLILSIIAGAALGVSSPADAACERINYDCPLSGPVVMQRCMSENCFGRCSDCASKGCSSSGCCYHEWITCPAWADEWDESVICGGLCLRTFDTE